MLEGSETLRVTRRLGFIAVAIVSLAMVGCGASSEKSNTLSVGLIPNQSPEEVQAQYQPLEDYLSTELDRPVSLEVPTSYNAVVEAMTSGELDLAYFGGLTYVQARERADISPLVTEINPRTGNTTYRSAIIAPTGSDIQNVPDIQGKDFAFGSVSSTSGSLYPSIMLKDAGVDYRTDLGEVTYTGGHDATAQAVANGRVDAGGLEYRILLDMVESGTIDKGSYRVIETKSVEGYPWVVRDDLPENLKEETAQAFLNIQNPELLDLLRAQGYERVQASDYDEVEKRARELDLLTATG
jgi:phosphonate transport system substrate-binding protein